MTIVFFDGVCGLCNRFVDFLIARDSKSKLSFAPLRGETAKRLLGKDGPQEAVLLTVILIDSKGMHVKSDAAIRTLSHLGGVWHLAALFYLVPRPLRDLVYDWVARNRYSWFGKRESCRLPAPAERARFFD